MWRMGLTVTTCFPWIMRESKPITYDIFISFSHLRTSNTNFLEFHAFHRSEIGRNSMSRSPELLKARCLRAPRHGTWSAAKGPAQMCPKSHFVSSEWHVVSGHKSSTDLTIWKRVFWGSNQNLQTLDYYETTRRALQMKLKLLRKV